ncbi:MAG: hypothetical protein HON92_11960 [Planctomycetaceae bacterium]|nr:hypothetical protein [Planctomycetaceae bacterium]MBT4011320.1 hypothetical protein [Planctomycetaceae bacterium]MBT4725773.1 hypothetical protein [Planctomycetaceae bacterium]MBT4846135.1 hypothetical protein [Planctomycetaceae bacterium]MBT5124309.1 hypothetical protein [Planctomycetaceae bacterium]
MTDWLTRISLSCFALSYLIALLLEISRLFYRISVRSIVIFALMLAGIFAHTIFLWDKFQADFSGGTPLASWYDWCLVISLALAVTYTIVALQRVRHSVGIFFLPVILGLILFAVSIKGRQPFSAQERGNLWGMTHGISLTAGTIAMAIAFTTGLMYLVLASRLKRKLPPRAGFHLPSLEWLQVCNQRSLFLATGLIMIGLFSGIIINKLKNVVAWDDMVVVSSSVLLLWLIVVSVFEMLYRPARQGKKIAYLTIASFFFLIMVLCFVIFGQHAEAPAVTMLWAGGGK